MTPIPRTTVYIATSLDGFITRIPILIGRGIPLFGPIQGDIRLRHIQTRSFPSGLVQSEYEVPHSRSLVAGNWHLGTSLAARQPVSGIW